MYQVNGTGKGMHKGNKRRESNMQRNNRTRTRNQKTFQATRCLVCGDTSLWRRECSGKVSAGTDDDSQQEIHQGEWNWNREQEYDDCFGSINDCGVIGTKTGLGIHKTGGTWRSQSPIWRLAPKRMCLRKPPRVNRRRVLQL